MFHLKASYFQTIQKTLQNINRRHFINDLFAFTAPNISLN